MQQATIDISKADSGSPSFSRLVVSLLNLVAYQRCNTSIGYPGLPNVKVEMELGDTMLYETTQDGILEVRLTAIYGSAAKFTVSQVAPGFGLGAAMTASDPNNLPFSEHERTQIAESIEATKRELVNSGHHTTEQLSLIFQRLDETYNASSKLGKKDWQNYVNNTLTALCISAAFSTEVREAFFVTVNSAFSWLFTNTAVLLQYSTSP
ncbi:hypothetical protein RAE19_05230 [Rhodoferax sp. TBRC 17660]|uniref:Uncharacterized protein n=1 Tax=Rhodoferax potami TaxID=3068338 RepID=A0ABU3KK31_9BURK|nr:hypothetical protein [Rhodoferax sp. TBRC 17660]MDT7518140.1 hypothetical protein [Rhodoferax sp. TBRC 17660]